MLIKPARLAPKPRVTKSAGSAQQSKVLVLVNRLMAGSQFCRQLVVSFSIGDGFNVIA